MMDPGEALERYEGEARRYPPMPRDEETRLLAAARAGDREARAHVIRSFLARTHDLAQRLRLPWMMPIVATQEANVTLMRLVDDAAVTDVEAALPGAIEEHFRSLESDAGDG